MSTFFLGSSDKSKKLPADWLIAVREVGYHFKRWAIVFFVVMIAVVLILVPANLTNTFGAPDFITYMGSSLEDILIEVENGANLETNYEKVKELLSEDTDVEKFYEYKTVRIQTIDADSKLKNIDVDCGSNAGNELKYLEGKAPENEYEIALSYLNAEDIGKKTGDSMKIIFNGTEGDFTITGIYQDVTSGGFTAKTKFDFSGVTATKYTFSVNLKDKSDVENKADEWSGVLGTGVSVDPMKEFINQLLGGVERQLKLINLVIIFIASCLAMLITVLYMKLRLVMDQSEIAVLKAIGFSEKDVRKQYLIKIGFVTIAGILTGIIVTGVLGEMIVNAVLGLTGMGIKRIDLIVNPFISYLVCPILLMGLILLVTSVVLRATKKHNIVSIINE